jgi:hypothetical protein
VLELVDQAYQHRGRTRNPQYPEES